MDIKISYQAFEQASERLKHQIETLQALKKKMGSLSFGSSQFSCKITVSTGKSADAQREVADNINAVIDELVDLCACTRTFVDDARKTYKDMDYTLSANYKEGQGQ